MSYYITEFDGLTLPTAKPQHTIGTDGSVDMGIRVAGGSYYDAMGTDKSNSSMRPIRARCILQAATAAALTTAYDAIKAKRGNSGTLTMVPGGGTATRTRTARMLEVNADNEPGQILWTPIEMIFMPVTEGWAGTAHSDSATLTASPGTVTATNNGNKRNTSAIITLTAGAAAITAGTIAVSGISSLVWSGTIASGQALVIDCGQRTVLNNGSDARSGLTLHATNHKISDWLRLQPGANSVVFTIAGGSTNSTANIAHDDLYE